MDCKKYCPSNGTEGEAFMEKHCYHCIHDNGDDKICDILMASMAFYKTDERFPSEWTYDDKGKPTCTEYKHWDWGKDDGGNWINPPDTPIDDPNQLCLPFIFDEIGIKKHSPEKELV